VTRLNSIITTAAAAACTTLAVSTASGQAYQITPLESPQGVADVFVRGINNLGQIVGYTVDDVGHSHATLWDSPTNYHELPTLATGTNAHAEAYRINDAGQIVGLSRTAGGSNHAAYWDASGIVDIGTLGGPSSFANDINDAGVVVGSAGAGPTGSRSFSWTKAGGLVDHGNFNTSDNQQYAGYNGINNNGLMVGTAYRLFTPYKATMGRAGDRAPTNISPPGQFTAGMAMAVNDAGTIVGWQDGPNGTGGPAIFNGDSTVQFLGNFGLGDGQALDINNAGQIVGFAVGFDNDGNQQNKSFLYEHGQMTDLMTLVQDPGWTLLFEATSINDRGDIVGAGVYNGEIRGFLMTSVPEPAGAATLVLAGGAILARRRRR
jgi:probable HAF family extracellular repeat protein